MGQRVLIVGGVAGGASCAARLRRLDEHADIQVFDRGPFVSFANCGLPYYVGDVIADERKLIVASAELFRERFNIAVHTQHEVLAIDRQAQTITVRDLVHGRERCERYDALVLAPGSVAVRPPVPGIDLPGIFQVRTIPDSRRLRQWIAERQARSAVVVGGGFIGLEMVENLAHRGLTVTVIEKARQLMPPLDPEMAEPVRARLEQHGVRVLLEQGVAGFALDGERLAVRTERGECVTADLVVLALGVRPDTALARAAGLAIGDSGGIRVDEQMRTSDPRIWAVGDAVESLDVVTGLRLVLPLAGPANRQGRVAAESIAGRPTHFRGVQGTSVCGVFGLTIAATGASEKQLQRAGIGDYRTVYLHPGHHVSYYPGAKPIHMKVLYRASDGRVLGAQAVGEEGVEKRIDVIAMAIQLGGTVHDLAESELCYAPQYGAAKDPVNLAGFIAENQRSGDAPLADWSRLADYAVLDVREPAEVARGTLPQALHIPLHELRRRHGELPTGRPLAVLCAVGQRAYYAVRLLRQLGYDARLLSGGWRTAEARRGAGLL
ncbi:MAG: FAD-dependent oxidoreductase [Planctomycetota bacterium]|nr:FAD-dependent oxidoreductase [Planctomycetota bacterium]MDW8372256.1 FAD-dependent oxidoreductase [Planctomycetota bacterium]